MNEQCVISVGNRWPYIHLLKRLVSSLEPYKQIDRMTWNDLPPGSKPHAEQNYGFKCQAFRQARNWGHRYVLWCDSTMQAVADPQPIFDAIKRDGYFLLANPGGWKAGEWISDKALAIIESDRDEWMDWPDGATYCFGLDFEHEQASRWFEEWCHYAELGAFTGPWENHRLECSPDPRCRGHRHDQVLAAVLARRYHWEFNAEQLVQPSPPDWPTGASTLWPTAVLVHGGLNGWDHV